MDKLKAFVWIVTLTGLLLGCGAKQIHSAKAHHDGSGFRNLHPHQDNGFIDFIKWRLERLTKDIQGAEAYNFPIADNDLAVLQNNGSQRSLTWIGHATLLLQIENKNILTDPHFSYRASPFQWAGPQRVVPPGLAIDELPDIDYVVISHDHYDSLDLNTIRTLRDRPGGRNTRFIVPLGLDRWFHDEGIDNVVALDWWQSHQEDVLEFVAVPVQHWSKRSLFERNKTLWAGWIIRSNGFNFLFAGDSGYTPHFKEVGRKFGPFDLAAIPIGAYEPRWFMGPFHITPEEAVRVHRDLDSRKSIGIHWGTFLLTDEPLDEPPKRLAVAKRKLGLQDEEFTVLMHGQTIILNSAR